MNPALLGGSRPAAALLVLLLHLLALAALWTLSSPLLTPQAAGQERVAVRLIDSSPPDQVPKPTTVQALQPRRFSLSIVPPAPAPQVAPAQTLPPTGSAQDAGDLGGSAPANHGPSQVALATTEPRTDSNPVAVPTPETLRPARRGPCAEAPHPPLLRERGIEGLVRLRVWVDEAGRAARVELAHSSGYRLLDEAASRQAQTCPYEPARRGVVAIGSWVEFPVRFALKSAENG